MRNRQADSASVIAKIQASWCSHASGESRLHLLHFQHRLQRALAKSSLRMLRLLIGAFDRREILQWRLRCGRRRIAEAQRFEGFPGAVGFVERTRAVQMDAALFRLDLLRLNLR
jgi:hypothetical protein